MRVTEAARFDQLRSDLVRTNAGLAEVTGDLASGRAIRRLSDDPELAVQADRLLSEDQALRAYTEAAENARAWLATQDGALQSAMTLLHRARELTISAGSPSGDQARDGIANEIDALRLQLVDVANTSFNGRSVFAGFSEDTVAEVGGLVNFVGDGGEVQRRIGGDRMIRVNIDGADAFGFSAGDDIFTLLADVSDHIRAQDTGSITGSDLDRLEDAATRIAESLGSVGATENQVDRVAQASQARRDEIRDYRSSIVDADLAETALRLTMAETAYESVLAATARLQLPTLVDYLR